MATPLLSVPIKTTDEVDWIVPLKNYIRQTYDDPEKFTEECATLQRLRQDMRGAGKDTTGRDLLYRYYGQLELLDLRFPIDENHVRISFTWYDAFSKKPISQYSLAYEKASIIFNIAATLSAIASGMDRSDSDGLKRAFHSLQASAGMFIYINDNFLHAPSSDLSRECVKLLSAIMLAQAQECVCQTQIRDGKRGKIMAKLANQASMMFGSVIEGLSEQVSQGTFERVWMILCQTKQKYFLSLAQYHHALADIQAEETGHAIARLNTAESTAREAQKLAPYLAAYTTTLPSDCCSVFTETIKSHLSIVTDLKATTQKDNDFIFHKIVPNEPQLPAIGKLSLAKPTSLTELYKADDVQRIIGGDLFAKLIPMSVTQSASMYSEEKAKLLRAEQEKSDVADGELVAALDHLQLPGSLKRFSESKEEVLTELRRPPQPVKDIAKEVATGERSERTANLIGKLQQLRSKAREGIQNALKQLDEEERECESMRAKYGSDWTQTPSASQTSSMRQELNSNKDTLEQAKRNDDLLEAQWMRYRTDIEVLASGEDGLALREEFKRIGAKAAAPSEGSLLDLVDDDSSAGSMGRVAENVQKVERGLSGLNVIKRERQTTLKQLKEAAHNDDISSVLILNKKNPNIESQLFTSELEKFRPYQTRLAGLIHKQQELLSEVVTAFKTLLQEQTGSKEQEEIEAAHQESDNYVARFRAARGGWEDVREGAQKGIHFYTSLNAQLDPVLAKVQKFITDRRAEGGALFKSIQVTKPTRDQERLREDLSRLTLSYGSKPPPPIPSPPTRTPSMPLYGYSQPPSQSYNYPSSPPPRPPPPPQNPQTYSPQGQYGYQPSQPPQPTQYGAPTSPYSGLPPPLQPRPGPQQYRPPPPPPPPSSQNQGQGGYRW